jgi:hypothetical protein
MLRRLALKALHSIAVTMFMLLEVAGIPRVPKGGKEGRDS